MPDNQNNVPVIENESTVHVPSPGAGQSLTVQSVPGGNLDFGFDISAATVSRTENNLVFEVDNGGKVTIEDFFAVGDQSLPTLTLPDGTVVASADFFQNSELDLTTAAGPGAGATTGSGTSYDDDSGALIAGLDKYGKLGTDYWGRATENDEIFTGLQDPGVATPNTTLPGGGFTFTLQMYEDWRPNQHQGDYETQVPGKIEFQFTPEGATVVDNVDLSGFTPGTEIYLGNPLENPDLEPIIIQSADDVLSLSYEQLTVIGVYVKAPFDDDSDMNINVVVTIREENSGITLDLDSNFTVVVDAVADKPHIQDAAFDDPSLSGTLNVTESASSSQGFEQGWAIDTLHKTETATVSGPVSLSVSFGAVIRFGDYLDGSEHHYALVEVPGSANGSLAPGDSAGTWTCFPADSGNPDGLVLTGTITLWFDAAGNVLGEGSQAPEGASYSKDFFQIEIPNEAIANSDVPGDYQLNLVLVSENGSYSEDTRFELEVGAKAEEIIAPGEQELDLDNNVSYDFAQEDGGRVGITVDTIDSTLEVRAGWVYEDNMPDKNLEAGVHSPDWTEGDYSGATRAPGQDGGAPLTMNISGSTGEYLTGATFTYNPSEAVFRVGDNALSPSNPSYTAANGTTFTLTAGADGTYTVTVSNLPEGATSLDGLGMNFLPGTQYSDEDIPFSYTANVSNAAGANAVYGGSSTVVVDAVADLSTEVVTDLTGPDSTQVGMGEEDERDLITATDRTQPDADGWERDEYSVDHSGAVYTINAEVSTTFPDHADPSERHYILVEKPEGWNIADSFGLSYTEVEYDGTTYYQIDVTAITHAPGSGGAASITVPLTTTGHAGDIDPITIQTGSFVAEGDWQGTGREYDTGNNTAIRLDGEEMTYTLDVVTGGIKVDTGWASEGNNDAKFLGTDAASGQHEYEGAQAGSTVSADAVNQGAPIVISLDNAGNDEFISRVEFTFNSERGSLMVLDGNGEYTSLNGMDGVSVSGGTVTITNPDILAQIGTEGFLIFRPESDSGKPASFDDTDVDIAYNVTVSNAAGSSVTYTGGSTVVIDAVADMSTDVESGLVRPDGHVSGYVDTSDVVVKEEIKEDGSHNAHDAQGWEHDEYSIDHSDVTYTFTARVSTSFPDHMDPSERHYVLVEKADGWEVDPAFSAQYSFDEVSLGEPPVTYIRVDVTDSTHAEGSNGEVTIDVPFNKSGIGGDYGAITIKTGSMAVEQNADGSGGNYDTVNDEAVRLDGTELTYTIDVVTGGLKVQTGWASEGNNDAKYQGPDAASVDHQYRGDESGSTVSTGGGVNQGAPIIIALDDTGNNESITSVELSFDASRGSLLILDGGQYRELPVVDGKVVISGDDLAQIGTKGGLIFRPVSDPDNPQSYNDQDVDITYSVRVVNQQGSSATYEGSASVVIDAVADMADVSGGSAEYAKDAQYGQQAAAKPGDTVTLNMTVEFPDSYGSEDHFIVIQAGADGISSYSTVTITGPGGTFTYNLSGHEPVTITDSNGNTGSYYKIPVTYTEGNSSWTVKVEVTADADLKSDTPVSVGLGGYSEVKNVDGQYADGEFDTTNNSALNVDPVEFQVSPADAGGKTSTVGTYESSDGSFATVDGNKHYDGSTHTVTEGDVTKTYSQVSISNQSKLGDITFTLNNPSGSTPEYMTELRFTVEGDLSEHGALFMGNTEIMEGAKGQEGASPYYYMEGGNTVVVIPQGYIPGKAGSTGLTVKYVPKAYDDTDIKITDYEMDVVNSKSYDTNTVTGTGKTVTVDAVAARPTDTSVDKVDYNGEQEAAKPGEKAEVEFSLTFQQMGDSNEAHYVLLTVPGHGSTYDSLVLSNGNGQVIGTYTAEQLAALPQITVDGNTFYKIPVAGGEGGLLADGEVSGVLTVQVPGTMTGFDDQGNATLNYVIAGMTQDTDTDSSPTEGAKNGAPTTSNDAAFDWTTATVNVNTVGSTLKVSVGEAFENATPDAHTGQMREDLTIDQLKKGGAAITVDFTQNDAKEAITEAVFVLDYKLGTLNEIPGQFLYKGVLIDAPTGTAVTIDGDTVSCTVDSTTGKVTIVIEGFDPVGSGGESNLYFIPANNYKSNDVTLDYAIKVEDSSSGQEKIFTNNESLLPQGWDKTDPVATETRDDPQNIDVDAVAQKPSIESAATVREAEDGGEYTHAVPGSEAILRVTANIQGDLTDGSEHHILYVEAKGYYGVKEVTVSFTGSDGNTYEVTVPASALNMGLQGYNGKTYHTIDMDSVLSKATGLPDGVTPTGSMTIDVKVGTPADAGASDTIKLGLVTYEDLLDITKGGDRENYTYNNKAEDFETVTIPYSTATQPGLAIKGYYFENNNADAHLGKITWGAGVLLDISTGDKNDALTDFNLSLTEGTKDLGDLWIFQSAEAYDAFKTAVEGGANPYSIIKDYATNMGDSISKGDLEGYFPKTGEGANATTDWTGAFGGKIVFIPAEESYSGQNPQIDYTIKVVDQASGQPSSSGASGQSITADAVAQRPLDPNLGEGTDQDGGNIGYGEVREVTITGTFADTDGTTQHYILVEAQGGWGMTYGPDKTPLGPDDLWRDADGTVYYKIPVTLDTITGHTGTATINVQLTSPNHHLFDGSYSMQIKAGSTDKDTKDGELTFHNNNAISADGPTITGTVGEGSSGRYHFEQDTPLYEDNMPNQHEGDYTTTKGASFSIATTDEDVDHVIITVPQDNDGNPLLELSTGNGVTLLSDGTYKVSLTDGKANVEVLLSDKYLELHPNEDADITGELTATFVHKDGNNSYGITINQVVVDAVADYAKIDDVSTTPDAGTIPGGATDAQIAGDGVVANAKGGADDTAWFTVNATFNDTDGSESHYVLVEKTPNWEPSSTGNYPVDAELIFVNGKAYYRFDVTDAANKGETEFEIGMTFSGKGSASDQGYLGKPDAQGVITYGLKVGTMSHEKGYDTTADLEYDLQNNIAINDTGSVTLKYSPLDSSGAMNLSTKQIVEGGEENITLELTGIATNLNDALTEFSVSYNENYGQLYLVTGDTEDGKQAIGSGFNGFTADQLKGLAEGTYTLVFEPDARNHQDITFTWTGKVQDTVSGATGPITGSAKVVVDAKADESTHKPPTIGDGEWTGVQSGQEAVITLETSFVDKVNVSEEHWVVLQQTNQDYLIREITVTDGTSTWTYGPDDLTTVFDDKGNPFFGLNLTAQQGLTQGDYTVKFTIYTPDSDTDITNVNLNVGTITIETTVDDPSGEREPDYSNNWHINTDGVEILTGVIETDSIKFTADPLVESSEQGTVITLDDATTTALANNNEQITDLDLTFTLTGAKGDATVIFNGEKMVITFDNKGVATWSLPDDHQGAFDPATDSLTLVWGTWDSEGNFVANHSGTGTQVSIGAEAIVTDKASGDTGKVTTTNTITFTATADAAESLSVGDPSDFADGTAHTVTTTVQYNFSFPDTDGSETHSLYFRVPDGISIKGASEVTLDAKTAAAMGLDAGTYYKAPLGATASSYKATLVISEEYEAAGQVQAFAVAQEMNKTYAVSQFNPVDVDVPTEFPNAELGLPTSGLEANLSLLSALAASGAFTFKDDDGDRVTLTPVGAHTAADNVITVTGDYGTLTLTQNSDLGWSYTYSPDASKLSGGLLEGGWTEEFSFTADDGYGSSMDGAVNIYVPGLHAGLPSGADVVFGTAGNDNLDLSAQIDSQIILGGGGNDIITGGAGGDVIYAGTGDNILYGGIGNDTLYGGIGNDTLYGGDGNDVLYAGGGTSNVLIGGAGSDIMYGASGSSDTFFWDSKYFDANSHDVVNNFELGSDKLMFSDLFSGSENLGSLLGNANWVAGNDGGGTLTASGESCTITANFQADGNSVNLQIACPDTDTQYITVNFSAAATDVIEEATAAELLQHLISAGTI